MLEKLILKRLSGRDYIPADIHGLRHGLRIKAHQTPQLAETLLRLEKSGKIIRVKRNRYALPEAQNAFQSAMTSTRNFVGRMFGQGTSAKEAKRPEKNPSRPAPSLFPPAPAKSRSGKAPEKSRNRTAKTARPPAAATSQSSGNRPGKRPANKNKNPTQHRGRTTVKNAPDSIPEGTSGHTGGAIPRTLVGRVRMSRRGDATFYPEDVTVPLIIIPARATGTALHGDLVEMRTERTREGQPSGSITKIVERARTEIVGTFLFRDNASYVVADDPRLALDILVRILATDRHRPNDGDKVLIQLDPWYNPEQKPTGTITEVLGPPDAPGVDMASILKHYNLPGDFSEAVLREAHEIGNQVSEADIRESGRIDCRKHPVVTIDPDDAKDFDDAICLQPLPGEQWKLWVHIADVSHYVKPGSPLDLEARKRGNSTYLVDRVIPMLPEELSNELCSLKPRVDRLTKCAEFTLDNHGKVLSTTFYPAVIHSHHRYAYQDVSALLKRLPQNPMEEMLHEANRLAQNIRRARFQNGSLDLEFPEMKIRLDSHGRFLRTEVVEHDESHQLIEEFMLLANEAVAERLKNSATPAVYRIHENPEPERLEEYRQDLKAQGINCGDLTNRREIQKLFVKIKQHPSAAALRIGFLRCLKRARYSPQSLGHYGLAKANYTHFTSPIRRYSDLIVHRCLFEKSGARMPVSEMNHICAHISDTERTSSDAEQDSKSVKIFGHLAAQLHAKRPETYPGLITELRNFGFFVEVPSLSMSGLVPLSSMEDDYYVYEEYKGRVTGRRHRKVYQVGDEIYVRPLRVDYFKKQVDFCLAPQS